MSLINEKIYQRFDERNSAFHCVRGGRRQQVASAQLERELAARATSQAAQKVHGELLASWNQETPTAEPHDKREEWSPNQATGIVREAATAMGADLVGIAPLDRKWLYSYNSRGLEVKLPANHGHAVVLAVAMELSPLRLSPGEAANAQTWLAYAKIAFVTSLLANFLRGLGFGAVPCVNDVALSIPLAVEAGLGTLGRSGVLLTEEYGPAVRLAKVFTDMPLEATPVKGNDLNPRCRKCGLCAAACPAGAISAAEEPSFEVTGPWNNPGIKRFAVDAKKCYDFWRANGTSCSTCIAVCPCLSSGKGRG